MSLLSKNIQVSFVFSCSRRFECNNIKNSFLDKLSGLCIAVQWVFWLDSENDFLVLGEETPDTQVRSDAGPVVHLTWSPTRPQLPATSPQTRSWSIVPPIVTSIVAPIVTPVVTLRDTSLQHSPQWVIIKVLTILLPLDSCHKGKTAHSAGEVGLLASTSSALNKNLFTYLFIL